MQNKVQNRVLNNYSIGVIGFFITFIQTLATVPILLIYWGNDIYGVWIALFAGFTLLQTFDFGHQSYIGNLLNVEYHLDKKKFSIYLGSSLLMAVLLGIFQLFLTIFLIASNYLNSFLGISIQETDYSVISLSILSLMLMWVISGSIGGILIRILIPAGYMTQSLIWGIIFKLAQFLTLITVAISGGKILEASIAYSLVQTILAILALKYIKNKMPEFFPWWKYNDLKVGFQNLRKSTVLTVNNTLQQLSNNGLILFITNVFSTSVVPAFTTVRTLTNTATVFTNLFITSIQPDLIKYHARQEVEKLQATINANWFFSGVVVNTGIIILLPHAEKIFTIWTKGLIVFEFKLFILLAASISVINFGAGLFNYLYGINSLFSISIISISRASALFLIAFFLSSGYGLIGVGMAVLISEIIASMVLPIIFVNRTLTAFNARLPVKNIIAAAAAPCLILVITIYVMIDLDFSLFAYGLSIFLCLLVYLFNWLILEKEIKIRFKDLFSNLFGKVR